MATLIRVDRNGTKYYEGDVPCSRCGGAGGADKWLYTGWTCYNCGGSGKEHGKWKEYTPEYEEKLAKRRQARREKWEAEHAEEIAQREAERKAKEEAERIAKEEEEARIKAEKAISQYIGKVGDKVDTTVTYIKTAWFDIPSFRGFGTDTMYIHTFKVDGNVVVWKTSTNRLGEFDEKGDWIPYEEGMQLHLKGTIKEHNEYKEEKQTVLTRCKITK